MSRRALTAFAVTLGLALVALPACGDDEPPAQREFTDDETETPDVPEEVRTQIRLRYVQGAFVVDIEADEDYCEEGRTVTIFEDLRKDKKVGKVDSSDEGDARLKKKRVVGRYYASVPTEPSAKYGELSICKGKRSRTIVVKK